MGSIRRWLLTIASLLATALMAGSCERTEGRSGGRSSAGEVTWMVAVGPDRPMFEDLLALFHELHPDIRIRPMWVPGSQYQTKLKTLIAAGKPPDIFWSGDVWVAYELPFLADLTDLVERDAEELDLNDFYPELLAAPVRWPPAAAPPVVQCRAALLQPQDLRRGERAVPLARLDVGRLYRRRQAPHAARARWQGRDLGQQHRHRLVG
jgi:hypothetical protein